MSYTMTAKQLREAMEVVLSDIGRSYSIWEEYDGVPIVDFGDGQGRMRRACVIHLWTELKADGSFGIFESIFSAVRNGYATELIVMLKRPSSNKASVFSIGIKTLFDLQEICVRGQQGQYQLPIDHFKKWGDFELA